MLCYCGSSFVHAFIFLLDNPTELQIRGGIKDNSNMIFLVLIEYVHCDPHYIRRRGVVGWCNGAGQCRGVLLIWIIVRQGPTALAVGAGGGGLDIFSLNYHFSLLSPSLWEAA